MPLGLIGYGLMALAIMASIGYGVHRVKVWGGDEVRAEWKQAEDRARAKEAAQQQKAAEELAAERAKKKTVIQVRTKYVDKILEKPVYRNVCFDDPGLSCLNAAIDGKDAAGCKPDSALPAPKPPG